MPLSLAGGPKRLPQPRGGLRLGAPAAAAAAPFSDTFTEASDTELSLHTSDSGHTWTRVAGSVTCTIVGATGRLRGSTSASDAVYRSSWVPASANYDILHQPDAVSGVNGMSAGGRVTASGDGYFASWGRGSDTFILTKRVGGVVTAIGSVATTGADGRDVKLVMRGSSIKVFANTMTGDPLVEVISVTDTDISAAGNPGVRATPVAYTNTTRVQIDSMSAVDA